MQNTLKHKMPFSNHLLITCQSRRKQNFFVKILRNIDPAISTFTFETQAVFHPAGYVTSIFVVPGKVTVKIGACKDLNKTPYIVFLDAKSAFDVVSHDSLLRKLFNIGTERKSWSLIRSLYQEAVSSVKWNGLLSDQFEVEQGVRQGGILSADFYKLYANNALLRVDKFGYDAFIGTVFCGASTCADDMLFATHDPDELQQMLEIGFRL